MSSLHDILTRPRPSGSGSGFVARPRNTIEVEAPATGWSRPEYGHGLAGLGCPCKGLGCAKCGCTTCPNRPVSYGAKYHLGSLSGGGGIDLAAKRTALAFLVAMRKALASGTKMDLSNVNRELAGVGDADVAEYLRGNIISYGAQAVQDVIEGNEWMSGDAHVTRAKKMAQDVVDGVVSPFAITHSGMNEAAWARHLEESAARKKSIEADIEQGKREISALNAQADCEEKGLLYRWDAEDRKCESRLFSWPTWTKVAIAIALGTAAWKGYRWLVK